jgi:hypothetical protein
MKQAGSGQTSEDPISKALTISSVSTATSDGAMIPVAEVATHCGVKQLLLRQRKGERASGGTQWLQNQNALFEKPATTKADS